MTTYSYDHEGRLQNVRDDARPDSPVIFRYDEQGRKTKIQTSSPADYRPNAFAGSRFEAADTPPNLPGGGSATTIYDEHDRAIEVQVRDAGGQLVSRAVRTYDAQGRIAEEKQILESFENMIPAEHRQKMLDESGLSPDQLRQELRAHLSKFMAGTRELYSVSYGFDAQGRITQTRRRVFNQEQNIETSYNEHGDIASEITRSARVKEEADRTAPSALPSYTEVRYSYKYDDHQNWIEKTSSYRSSPDSTFQPSNLIKRTLTYY